MLHTARRAALALCAVLMLLPVSACKEETPGDQTVYETVSGVTMYEDAYQKGSTTSFDDIELNIRTSSPSYASGSIVVVSATVENNSDYYYALKVPAYTADADALVFDVVADGYALEPFSQHDAGADTRYIMLEPHSSIYCSREYLASVLIDGQSTNLWQCEPQVNITVYVGPSFLKRESDLANLDYQPLTLSAKFTVESSAEKTQ